MPVIERRLPVYFFYTKKNNASIRTLFLLPALPCIQTAVQGSRKTVCLVLCLQRSAKNLEQITELLHT